MPLSTTPPDLLTRNDVARLLGVPLRELTWWIWGIRESRRYDVFEIPRRSGAGPRTISAPIKPIKDLQRSLNAVLSSCYRAPAHAHGFVPGRSPISNARVHLRQEWVLRLDIEDFFPSINFGRVLGLFESHPFNYPHDVAVMLAQLCCHRNELPQGAPTSPVIANMICRAMDRELATLASDERSYYSRYADDLCFSTDRRSFPASLATLVGEETKIDTRLEEIITGQGFRINDEKSRLVRRTQRQRVTGLVVNAKLNVSRDYVRHLRKVLYIWREHDLRSAEEYFAHSCAERGWPPGKEDPDFRLVVRGRVQFVGNIKGWSSPVYRRLAAALSEVDPEFKIVVDEPSQQTLVRLNTEGPTDIDHILAAQSYFHMRREFLGFKLEATKSSAAGSDSKLLERCRVLEATAESPSVCVFDTDSREARKAVGRQGLKSWGPLVAAVGLVPPPWLKAGEPVCIELLHEDSVLKTMDEDGRRIYLRSEFGERSPRHKTSDLMIRNANNRSLIQEEVFDGNNASVAMTKMDFAHSIRDGAGGFSGISFEGFRGTFELIAEGVSEIRRGRSAPRTAK